MDIVKENQAQNNGFELPPEVQGVDVIIVERVRMKDGSIRVSVRTDGSDDGFRKNATSFEVVGFLEYAKSVAIQNCIVMPGKNGKAES